MAEDSYGYGKKPLWQWIVIYLIAGVLVYGVIYYIWKGKSGGYNYTPPATPTEAMSPSPMGAAKTVLTMVAENGSGETGTATLEDVNGKTKVTLALTGFAAGVSQPAHIHVGACPGVGAVKYPLTVVTNGASVTMLDVSLSDLKAQLPLALNVHKSAKEVSVYTACAPLAF